MHSFSVKKITRHCAAGIALLATTALAHAEPAPSAQTAGHVISAEPLSPAFSLPDAGTAYRVTYLSTDGLTQKGLVPVTEEVILPKGKAPKGGWPIVAWAHGTVGVNSQCAPSLAPYTERNRIYLSAWMKRGFAIVATDYQGLGTSGVHPYLNTRVEAYSVLDGVRAALSSYPLKNKVMIVGQSQGGGAAVASASFAPEYAPDIDIRGTVATGVPYLDPALMAALLKPPADGKVETGFNPLIVYALYLANGLAAHDAAFTPEEAFTAKAMPAYRAAAQSCVSQLTEQVRNEGLNFQNAIKPEFSKLMAPAIADMRYPTLKLAQPLFVGTGSEDRDVPPALQFALVKAACTAGSNVQAHVYKGLDHSQTVNASLPDSATFTAAVMAGKPVASTCGALNN